MYKVRDWYIPSYISKYIPNPNPGTNQVYVLNPKHVW